MTFTDEDLKRLKNSATLSLSCELLALIARLEAAEDPNRFVPHLHRNDFIYTEGCLRCVVDKAWREAAGK